METKMDEIEPPKKRGGIHITGIGGSPHKQETVDVSGLRQDINSMGARLRLLEEGFANLRRMSQITEENMIAKNKYYSTELKSVNSDMNEMKKEIIEIKGKIILIIKELETTAKREDVKVLEKYINFWNPIKFVTYEQVEDAVNGILKKSQ